MTKFGKFLVFANLFVGVGLFSWAVSLYANGMDYFDRAGTDPKVEGAFTKLKREVDELNAVVTTSQREYARKAEIAKQLENERFRRLTVLTRRLAETRRGDDANIKFYTLDPLAGPLVPGFPDLGTAAQVFDVSKPGKEVRSTRDTPLQDLGFLRSQMANSVKEEQQTAARIREARRKMDALNTEIEGSQTEVFAQKLIRTNLKEQAQFLGDSKVNWDQQLNTLERRQRQLEGRLTSLERTTRAGGGD